MTFVTIQVRTQLMDTVQSPSKQLLSILIPPKPVDPTLSYLGAFISVMTLP